MKSDKLMDGARKLSRRYRVKDGKDFRLADVDPGDTAWLKSEDKPEAKEVLRNGIELLAELQDMLYAQDRWARAADLPGDGRRRQGRRDQARHVGRQSAGLPGLLVQGPVGRGAGPRLPVALRQASAGARPDRHLQPLLLRGGPGRPGAPGAARTSRSCRAELVTKNIWDERYRDIRAWERYLDAQRRRRAASSSCTSREASRSGASSSASRTPTKNWKFSATDAQERGYWKDYMRAYEDMIRNTATKHVALVRGAGRQQVVHADRRRRRRHRHARLARPGTIPRSAKKSSPSSRRCARRSWRRSRSRRVAGGSPAGTVRLDVVAGLTAAAVVIPKAMAYATIAGLPVEVGLYTAFVPMLVYAAPRHVARRSASARRRRSPS